MAREPPEATPAKGEPACVATTPPYGQLETGSRLVPCRLDLPLTPTSLTSVSASAHEAYAFLQPPLAPAAAPTQPQCHRYALSQGLLSGCRRFHSLINPSPVPSAAPLAINTGSRATRHRRHASRLRLGYVRSALPLHESTKRPPPCNLRMLHQRSARSRRAVVQPRPPETSGKTSLPSRQQLTHPAASARSYSLRSNGARIACCRGRHQALFG